MIKVKGTQAKKTYFTKTVATGTTKVKLYWKKIAGAEGYKIYKKEGSKYVLTKTVKGQNKSSVTIKGLTKNKKAYFKIATYSGKITSGKSASVWEKPRDNAYTESPSTKVKNYKANSLSIALKKVSYNKKDQLQFKALLVNRNNRRVSSFSKITIRIYLKGELIGKQTFREKKVDLKKGKTKTMTFTLNKGTKKKGANLRVAEEDLVVDYDYGYRLG